ncbi:Hypothetical_protein [Hexamita inflata]|uniref:Hypothetical_protein n=1 Tax=Hexamita inflata TaxID=28002 RepID=A0AA86PY02_9EUKA|nr:Hypothetical protein HINF_LOCUS36080 [Hexamita inflata]
MISIIQSEVPQTPIDFLILNSNFASIVHSPQKFRNRWNFRNGPGIKQHRLLTSIRLTNFPRIQVISLLAIEISNAPFVNQYFVETACVKLDLTNFTKNYLLDKVYLPEFRRNRSSQDSQNFGV